MRTQRRQTSVHPRGDIPRQFMFVQTRDTTFARIVDTVSGIDHDPGSRQVAAARVLERLAFTNHRHRGLLVVAMKIAQQRKRLRTSDAVDFHPHVELEFAHSRFGALVVDPVVESAVESESVKSSLQFAHVVPVHRGLGDIQQAITESKRGADEREPCVFADVPVGRQATGLLECADRSAGVIAKHSRFVGTHQADLRQTSLDVFDGGAYITEPNPLHVSAAYASTGSAVSAWPRSYGSVPGPTTGSTVQDRGAGSVMPQLMKVLRSLSNAALPLAPTMRASG